MVFDRYLRERQRARLLLEGDLSWIRAAARACSPPGLASGVHCVGMCGGIVAAFSCARDPQTRDRPAQTARLQRRPHLDAMRRAGAAAGALGAPAPTPPRCCRRRSSSTCRRASSRARLGLHLARRSRAAVAARSARRAALAPRAAARGAVAAGAHAAAAFAAGLAWGWLPCGLVYGALAAAAFAGGAARARSPCSPSAPGTLPWLLAAGLAAARLRAWCAAARLRRRRRRRARRPRRLGHRPRRRAGPFFASRRKLMKKAITDPDDEHRSISAVLHGLKELARMAQDATVRPRFQVFRSMIRYIDEFPEQLHHPKEDEHLFARLRGARARGAALVEELQAEHVEGARLVRELERALLFFEEGWPGGRARVPHAVDAYAEFHWKHMRKEEQRAAAARRAPPHGGGLGGDRRRLRRQPATRSPTCRSTTSRSCSRASSTSRRRRSGWASAGRAPSDWMRAGRARRHARRVLLLSG